MSWGELYVFVFVCLPRKCPLFEEVVSFSPLHFLL